MHPTLENIRHRTEKWASRIRLRTGKKLPKKFAQRILPPANPTLVVARNLLAERFDNIPQFNRDLEDVFVRVGQGLEEKSNLAHKLIEQSEELVAYVTGANGGEKHLHETTEVLSRPLQFIDECLDKASKLATRLRHHEKQLETVRGLEVALNNTIAPLKFIQTLFKVESATLPDSVQSIFVGLTKDIEGLHLKVAEIFGEHFQSLARSHGVIVQLIERLEVQVHRHAQQVQEKKELIQKSIATLQEEMLDNDQRDVRLASASLAICDQSSRIVMGIQFQDITRQKLEHISQAMQALNARLDRLAENGTDYEDTTSQTDLHYVKEACSLQASHLLTVIEDITRAETDIHDGLVSLRDRTQDLDSECVRLQHFKSVSAAEDGMVQVLLDILASVRVLVDETLRMQEDIYLTVKPLGGLATNLTSTMRTMSHQIKLIALNAQIQAAHTGQGTGLEVLAGATCRISDETYEFNETTAADLDAFVWGLENIITECGKTVEDGRQIQALLAEEGNQAEQQLHDFRNATLDAMIRVGEITQAIAEKSHEIVGECRFKDIATQHVEALFKPLHQLFEACDHLIDGEPTEEQRRQTEHLKPNYTMASERAVHEALDQGQAGILATASGEQGSYDAFSDEAKLDSQGPSFPVLPNLEAIATARRAERVQQAVPAQKASAPELGENVELF